MLAKAVQPLPEWPAPGMMGVRVFPTLALEGGQYSGEQAEKPGLRDKILLGILKNR